MSERKEIELVKQNGQRVCRRAYIRQLEISDIESVVGLQQCVETALENSQWYAGVDRLYFERILSDPEVYAPGIFLPETGALVGFGFAIPWKDEAENYGYDLDLPAADRRRCINLELFVVHPAWRGNGMQKTLLDLCLCAAEKDGYQFAAVTVAPDNIFSKANIAACGFSEYCQKEKYGGYVRSVQIKKLSVSQE